MASGLESAEVIGATKETAEKRNDSVAFSIYGPQFFSNERLAPMLIILGTLTILTLIGNVLVIVAIITQPTLRKTIVNRTIASLAVAGLLVSLFVMPIAILNEISQVWFLGDAMCDAFVFLDVNFCTASILHLLAIAIDRYLSATKITYFRIRHICINGMLASAWVIAALLSTLPLLGWRDPELVSSKTGMCLVSGDPWFAVFGTTVAFYAPTGLIIAVYLKVYFEVKRRIKQRMTASSLSANRRLNSTAAEEATRFVNNNSKFQQQITNTEVTSNGGTLIVQNSAISPLAVNSLPTTTVVTALTPPLLENRPHTKPPDLSNDNNSTEDKRTVSPTPRDEARSSTILSSVGEQSNNSQKDFAIINSPDSAIAPAETPTQAETNAKPMTNSITILSLTSTSPSKHEPLGDGDNLSETGTVYDNVTAAEAKAMKAAIREQEQLAQRLSIKEPEVLTVFPVSSNDQKQQLYVVRKEMASHTAPPTPVAKRRPSIENRSNSHDEVEALEQQKSHSVTERRSGGPRFSLFKPRSRTGGNSPIKKKKQHHQANDRRVSVAMALMAVAVDHVDFSAGVAPLPFHERLVSYGTFEAERQRTPSQESSKRGGSRGKLLPNNQQDKGPSLLQRIRNNSNTATNKHGTVGSNSSTMEGGVSDRTAMWKQREHKTAAILLIVTSAFIICWLPYFVLELATPLCRCEPYLPAHPLIRTAVTWLGYCNSLFNPIIYTATSADFRLAFKTLLRLT